MTESENSDLEIHEPAAFGQQLMLAREKAGLSIEEAARSLNLTEEMVTAIEHSALEKLPPVAFVRGYVRTYAKILGLPEDRIVEEFDAELPDEPETKLHPRSALPAEADSQTPVIKLISAVIIVSALAVLIYAVYSYYSDKSGRIEQASLLEQAPGPELAVPETGELEQSPMDWLDEAPTADAEADEEAAELSAIVSAARKAGEIDVSEQESVDIAPTASESAAEVEPASPLPDTVTELTAASVDEAVSEDDIDSTMPVVPTVTPITGGDVLVVSAEQQSWAEIVDANDIRLFYGMIEPGRDLNLTGQAPFEVFLGNAPVVSLSLNATEIDMTKYIRSNNIAQFKISVEDGRIRFH